MLVIPESYWVSILPLFTASLMILAGIARRRQDKLWRERALAPAAAKRN